ncbi:MAG: chemotaxis histidine kinase/response regulator CheAY2 [Ignavibacterium sp.]
MTENNEQYEILKDPDMKEIFESFVVETKEILEKLDLDLISLEKEKENKDLLNDIFRSFHTVKGTSSFLGLNKLMSLTHNAEDLLNKLRKGEAFVNENVMNAILFAYDGMKELLSTIETNLNENYDIEPILNKLKNVLNELGNNDSPSSDITGQNNPISIEEKESDYSFVNENENVEENNLERKEEVPFILTNVLNDKSVFQEQSTEKKETVKTTTKIADNTIRVDVERLDNLLNIVTELVLGRNRLAQVYKEAMLEYEGTKLIKDLEETHRQIDLMTSEIQLAVMKIRMIKIAKVFNKFPRLVRDMSKETKKEIQLLINGEDTELDKTLIEEINDPLVHIIRNSIDHGIELPEVRLLKGKPKIGTIKISAYQEGNNVVIIVEDDGKGINPEEIKAKTISKGIIAEEKANEFSKQEIYNLIFLPGFSTAEVVTNISGRGVGMDVVRTHIMKLRGIINIESEVDVGTKIIIKIPLTLAIIQGLLVKALNEIVAIPLSSVLEVVRLEDNQIYSVNQKEVIQLRDSVIPIIDLSKILYQKSNGQNVNWHYIVIVGLAEKKYGIKVDSLLGLKEIVIKNLGTYLGNIKGIAGSTILENGSVVMIVDLSELINQ